jgi:hypothetical protein
MIRILGPAASTAVCVPWIAALGNMMKKTNNDHAGNTPPEKHFKEVDMHDTKERLSLFWIFALLNYLYADVLALFAFVGSPNSAPHLPQWALLGSAVLMEIPIAMIPASRLLPFRANRLANIIAGCIMTLVDGFLTFVLPLTNGDFRDPVFPAYVFFATIETVCTSVIIWQAWTWSGVETVRMS